MYDEVGRHLAGPPVSRSDNQQYEAHLMVSYKLIPQGWPWQLAPCGTFINSHDDERKTTVSQFRSSQQATRVRGASSSCRNGHKDWQRQAPSPDYGLQQPWGMEWDRTRWGDWIANGFAGKPREPQGPSEPALTVLSGSEG